ncbi:hypothetical protein SUGI_0656800 [Cryptomeria japonica]|nr:hypothetical protein SUGI_0656800 [Cryptomeria japonica]
MLDLAHHFHIWVAKSLLSAALTISMSVEYKIIYQRQSSEISHPIIKCLRKLFLKTLLNEAEEIRGGDSLQGNEEAAKGKYTAEILQKHYRLYRICSQWNC